MSEGEVRVGSRFYFPEKEGAPRLWEVYGEFPNPPTGMISLHEVQPVRPIDEKPKRTIGTVHVSLTRLTRINEITKAGYNQLRELHGDFILRWDELGEMDRAAWRLTATRIALEAGYSV